MLPSRILRLRRPLHWPLHDLHAHFDRLVIPASNNALPTICVPTKRICARALGETQPRSCRLKHAGKMKTFRS